MQALSSKFETDDDFDRVLLRKVGSGCKDSFTQLYERCYAPVTRFAYRTIQDPGMVEEVVNDSLFTVWEKASTFRGDSRVMTWILGITMRKCWQAIRANRVHSNNEELPEELPERTNELNLSHTQLTLATALNELSPEHRACVELAYSVGFSGEEIAEVMECPVNTVKTRLHHARKYLRDYFQRNDVKLNFSDFAKDVAPQDTNI